MFFSVYLSLHACSFLFFRWEETKTKKTFLNTWIVLFVEEHTVNVYPIVRWAPFLYYAFRNKGLRIRGAFWSAYNHQDTIFDIPFLIVK